MLFHDESLSKQCCTISLKTVHLVRFTHKHLETYWCVLIHKYRPRKYIRNLRSVVIFCGLVSSLSIVVYLNFYKNNHITALMPMKPPCQIWENIYILIRVCDSSSDPHGPLIANPSGCLKSMWASHVTSRVKVCLYNEIRTHQPISFLHPSRLVSLAAILSTAMTYKLRYLTPADLT